MRYLTGKHLSRRTLLRGAGAAIALPLLESMIPAGDPRRLGGRRAALAARLRLHSARLRHESLDARLRGPRLRVQPILQSLEPFRERVNIVSGLKLHGGVCRRVLRGRESLALLAMLAHVHAAGHGAVADLGRPSRRAARRAGHAAAVARARARGRRVDLVFDAADAAADGGESARRVRAPARRRQHSRPSAPHVNDSSRACSTR